MNILGLEAPHYIENLFITKEIQESGKYILKLYSYEGIKNYEIDDLFPCYTYTVISYINFR